MLIKIIKHLIYSFLVFFLLPANIFATTNSDSVANDQNSRSYQIEYYSQSLGFNIGQIANVKLYDIIDRWIGTPYKYAGKTEKGIDCSGFASVLYTLAFEINLPAGSRNIFTEVTTLSKNQLEEGDLVFFKIRKGQISHVGVYLGENKFAHSSTQAGVIISDLDEPYYKRYYYKGGRHRNFSDLAKNVNSY